MSDMTCMYSSLAYQILLCEQLHILYNLIYFSYLQDHPVIYTLHSALANSKCV